MSKYDSIINLAHFQSDKRPRMSANNRAAQFAPFAALAGYYSALNETVRITDKKIEIDEYTMEILNKKINIIKENIKNFPQISVMYFVPDTKKSGGKYLTYDGQIRLIDDVSRILVFEDGTKINLDDILEIVSVDIEI